MNPQILALSVTFLSVSAVLAALGLFLRDLFRRREEPKRRLEFAAVEPAGDINSSFFRLVEESGTLLDFNAALLLVAGGAVVVGGIPLALWDNLPGAAVGVVVGAALPIVYLSILRWRRLATMRKALPQALQAVADGVRGGQTLSDACQLAALEIKGPLGDEFDYAHSQLELGHAPIPVMNRMVRRVPLPEFRIFATAVIVHRRAGGNLSLLAERMSHAARDRQDVQNQLMAVTSGSRLSAIGMAVGSIVAVALLFWLQPDYILAFLNNPKGPWLLAIAAGLQILGGLWVWRILRTNY